MAIGLSIGNEDLLLTANRETDFEFMGSTAIAQEEYLDKVDPRFELWWQNNKLQRK